MAVNFAPPAVNPSRSHYYNHHASSSHQPSNSTSSAHPQRQQRTTPDSSATATPTQMSPTSPRPASNNPTSPAVPPMSFQTRQLRPPKNPLYVPAVLRPTERPMRLCNNNPQSHSKTPSQTSAKDMAPTATAATTNFNSKGPLTPPSSAGNSYDGKDILHTGFFESHHPSSNRLLSPESSTSSFRSPPHLQPPDDSYTITRIVTDEWQPASLLPEQVTGTPTRDHWKPDSCSSACDTPTCGTTFSLLHRRHHCRRCGQIFCAEHSAYNVPLDQHARFHPQGAKARACGNCWKDFRAWERLMGGRVREGSSTSSSSGEATPVNTISPFPPPTGAQNEDERPETATSNRSTTTTSSATASSAANAAEIKNAVGRKKSGQGKMEMIVGSITRDLNWSTF